MSKELKRKVFAMRKALKETISQYGNYMEKVPEDEWPTDVKGKRPLEVWNSRLFCAMLWEDNGFQRLSMCRTALKPDGSWEDGLTWDEVNRVKSECGYHDRWAVEVYPPQDSIVNVANMRHIWLLDKPPSYGWSTLKTTNL